MSQEARSPIELLRDLNKGTLSPRNLTAEPRRSCVEHLIVEGYSAAEAAEILKVSLRTVQRDLAQIREDLAREVSPSQRDQIIGRMLQRAEQAFSRLSRIARDRATEPAVQVAASYNAWRVECESIGKLQSLGFLPTAAQQVRADVHHVPQAIPSIAALEGDVAILESALESGDAPPQLKDRLPQFRSLLAQAKLARGLQEISSDKDGHA